MLLHAGCKGTEGEKDQFGVVEHERNGGGVGREGSLVNEGVWGKRRDSVWSSWGI